MPRVAALAVAAAFLTGCALQPAAAPTPSPAPTSTQATPEAERQYLTAVRGQLPGLVSAQTSDAELLRPGQLACEALDGPASAEQVAAVTAEAAPQVGTIILVGAVLHLCPEHRAEVEAWARS